MDTCLETAVVCIDEDDEFFICEKCKAQLIPVGENDTVNCPGCGAEVNNEGLRMTLCERCSEYKANVAGREKQLSDGSFIALRDEEEKCDDCWNHDDGSDEHEDSEY